MTTSSSAGIRAAFRNSWSRSSRSSGFVYGSSSSSSSLSGPYQESVLRLELEPPSGKEDDNKNPIWFAGETLRGVVSYNRRLRGAATSLHLSACGNERAHIASRPSSSRADRPILHLDTVLCEDVAEHDGAETDWQDVPFVMELPATLPSSVRVDADAGRSYTSILYKIRTELRCGNMRSNKQFSVVAQCEARVTIQASPEIAEVVPWRMKPTTVEVKQFGVAKMGTVSFACRVADTHASKGQTIKVNFASRNNATIDLDYLELRLLELVTWQAKGRQCEQKNVLVDRRCSLSDIMSHDNRGPNPLLAAADQLHEDNYREIFMDLHFKRHVIDLIVPDTALDSYKGKVMSVQHSLRVRLKTSVLISDPTVEIPLKIRNYVEEARAQRRPPFPTDDAMENDEEESILPTDDESTPREDDEKSPAESKTENDDESPSDDDNAAPTNNDEEESRPSLPARLSRRGLRRSNADQSVRLMARESLRTCLPAVSERENEAEASQSTLPEEEDEEEGKEEEGEEEEVLPSFKQPERTRSTTHPLVSIPSFRLVTGGATILERSINDGLSASTSRSSINSTDTADMVQDTMLAEEEEQANHDGLPSLESLLNQMLRSMDDFDIIQSKLEQTEWRDILSVMEPDEFGNILAHVHLDFDQPKVAACIASNIMMEGKQPFTCEHVKVAVETAVEWNRCTMVSRLLPFCTDVETNRFVILDILEPWELTITAHDFESALNATA